jgi:hypothetical protein
LAGLALACGPRKDPVRAALDRVVAGAEGRDASDVVACLTADYTDAEHASPAEVELTLKRYLLAYESLRISLSDVQVDGGPTRARATFRASLSGTPRAVGGLDAILPRSSSYRFDVLLVKDGARFKIAKAAWSAE